MWRLAFVAAVALGGAACSSGGGSRETGAGPTDAAPVTQSVEVDGVTVEVTWLTLGDVVEVDADLSAYPPDRFALLDVKLDTHSGDLMSIDMEQAATLKQGETQLQPEAWMSVSDDSHHREGVLVFPRRLDDGPVELTIQMDDEELVVLWEATP